MKLLFGASSTLAPEKIKILTGHWNLLASHDNRFATSSSNGTICVWGDLGEENIVTLKPNETKFHYTRALHFLSNNRLASTKFGAFGDSSVSIVIWDIANKCEISTFMTKMRNRDKYPTLALPNDRLIIGNPLGEIEPFDLTSGRYVTTFGRDLTKYPNGYIHSVSSLQLLSDGCVVSAGNCKNGILIWDIRNNRCVDVLQESEKSRSSVLQVLPNDGLASAGHDGVIRIWDMKRRRCISHLRGHKARVTSLLFHDDYLISGGDNSQPWNSGKRDNVIRIWDISNLFRQHITSFENENGHINSLQTLPGELLAAESNGGFPYEGRYPYNGISVWDLGFRSKPKDATSSIATITHKHLEDKNSRPTFQLEDNVHKKDRSPEAISQQPADKQKKHASTPKVGQADDKPLTELEFLESFDGEASNITLTHTEPSYDSLSSSSIPQSYSRSTVASAQLPTVKKKRVSPILSTLSNSVEVLSETEDFSISRKDFEALTKQLEKSEKRYAITVEMLQEKIDACEQQLMPSAFSSEDMEAWQAHLTKYRKKEALLLERQVILSNPIWEAYYRAIQIHFSGLMIASLGIGTGYVPVNNSKQAKAFKYVAAAIGFAFPTHHVSVITSAASDAVNFLDARARKDFLKKINVFGCTQTEAEVLGEKIARLLLRARVHAGNDISPEQADRDAAALIKAILQASEPIARNKNTALKLLQMILQDMPYCVDSLPLAHTTGTKLASSSAVFTSTYSSVAHKSIDVSDPITSTRFEAEICELRDNLHTIQERIKDTSSQTTVLELAQQIQNMQKEVGRLKESDRFVGAVETVTFSNGSQAQAQLLVKRHDSACNETTHQEQIDKKERQIALLEEQMQAMSQKLVMLEEHMLIVVQQSLMAEDEKRGIVDDINSSNCASERIQRRTPQRRIEETLTKYSLFGQSVAHIPDAKNQDRKPEATKKKTANDGLESKTTIQLCIQAALLDATAEYIRFCDMQNGITSHGGSASRVDCQALTSLARQDLSTQLFYLIQRLDSHASSSNMGVYSLDTFIVNVLVRKSSKIPLLQTKISAINLSASDKAAIKIPSSLFGIYSDSNVAENCFRREQIRRVLMEIQQELVADCSFTETVCINF